MKVVFRNQNVTITTNPLRLNLNIEAAYDVVLHNQDMIDKLKLKLKFNLSTFEIVKTINTDDGIMYDPFMIFDANENLIDINDIEIIKQIVPNIKFIFKL